MPAKHAKHAKKVQAARKISAVTGLFAAERPDDGSRGFQPTVSPPRNSRRGAAFEIPWQVRQPTVAPRRGRGIYALPGVETPGYHRQPLRGTSIAQVEKVWSGNVLESEFPRKKRLWLKARKLKSPDGCGIIEDIDKDYRRRPETKIWERKTKRHSLCLLSSSTVFVFYQSYLWARARPLPRRDHAPLGLDAGFHRVACCRNCSGEVLANSAKFVVKRLRDCLSSRLKPSLQTVTTRCKRNTPPE